jgi:tRNA(Ile)-lysidine synthase
MLNQLLEYVNKQKLFQPDESILLTVSGGIDSVALMHLFQAAGFNFAVAHCNFQLRGTESDEDEAFVRDLSDKFEVRIFVKHFDTAAHAKKHGISIQMAARELRRSWFEDILANNDFSKIATAHHLNDSLETAIFNLAKGTGIAGLQGILPVNGRYIRPLLFASRAMIRDYVSENQIKWREDRSNISTKYARNKIRHDIIPELKKINPNLEFTFAETSEKIVATTQLFRAAISDQINAVVRKAGDRYEIDKNKLGQSSQPGILLHEFLVEFGFNYKQAKDIVASLERQPGKVFLSENYQLVMDREFLFLTRSEAGHSEEVLIDQNVSSVQYHQNKLDFELLGIDKFKMDADKNVAFIDLDLLKFPLKIRTWKRGDFFYPLGMTHKKKVSDFMIDEKIPVNLKNQIVTIFSGEDLVWIVGRRIDNRYKITKQTRNILKISNDVHHD